MGLCSLNTCYKRTQAEEWILSYISPRKFPGHPHTHSSKPSLETHVLGSCRFESCALRDAWEPEQSSEVKHILREPGLEKQEGEGLCVLWASTAAWFWGMEGQEANNAEKCREEGWATQWNDCRMPMEPEWPASSFILFRDASHTSRAAGELGPEQRWETLGGPLSLARPPTLHSPGWGTSPC